MIICNKELLKLFTCIFIDLMVGGFEPVTHGFELVTLGFEVVTRGFRLFIRGFELALLIFNSCF